MPGRDVDTNRDQSPRMDATRSLERYAGIAKHLNDIGNLATRVISVLLAMLGAVYWLAGSLVARTPRRVIVSAVFTLVLAAVFLGIWWWRRRLSFTGVKRAVAGGLAVAALGLAAGVWLHLPPKPAWQRVDYPGLGAASRDLPLALLDDELSGRHGRVPGGTTYQALLEKARGEQTVLEAWAGYYAPILAPSTIPRQVSLRADGPLNASNASLGIIVVVWSENDGVVRLPRPKRFGYDTLRDTVDVTVNLAASERAGMFVFVYPWTRDASASLPSSLESVVRLR